MGTSTGTSSSGLQTSSSDEDLQQQQQQQQVMDQRKRKRMLSNRESARRSRVKKQRHLDDLMSQMGQLRKENNEIVAGMEYTSQLYTKIEAENSILRAQMSELCQRLDSLNEIINYADLSSSALLDNNNYNTNHHQINHDYNPWSSFYVNQPIMDMVMY